jgi:hypothetical protein
MKKNVFSFTSYLNIFTFTQLILVRLMQIRASILHPHSVRPQPRRALPCPKIFACQGTTVWWILRNRRCLRLCSVTFRRCWIKGHDPPTRPRPNGYAIPCHRGSIASSLLWDRRSTTFHRSCRSEGWNPRDPPMGPRSSGCATSFPHHCRHPSPQGAREG